MLSKKHYETIASIIKDNTLNDDVLNETYIDKEAFINDLTSYFNSDNNRFSWERFVEACD